MLRQAASPEVLISCGIGFIGISAVTTVGPVLGQIQDHFALSHVLVGLIGSLFGFARLLVDLPGGRLVSRFDERVLSGVGLIVLGGGSVLGMLAGTYPLVLLARVLMGIGQSISSIANLVWLSNTASTQARTTAMAMYQTSIVAALSLFPLLGGLLGDRYGWRAAFGICAVASAMGIGLVGLALARSSDPRARAERRSAGVSEVFVRLDRRQRLGLIGVYACVFLLMFNSVGFLGTLVPLFADDVLGFSSSIIGAGLAIASLIGLVITIPGGIWADRTGPLAVLLTGLSGIVVGSLAFLVVSEVVGFMGAASVVGLYALSSSVPMALLTDIVPADVRGMAVGIYRLIGDVGVLIGPVLLAWMVDVSGYRMAIVVSAAVAAAVVLAAWRLMGPCVAREHRRIG
jgi:MFS family permease